MEFNKIKSIHNDVFAYHKKYADVQNDEKFLKSMISDKDALLKKYRDSTFAKDMIFAVYKSLISTWRARYTGSKT